MEHTHNSVLTHVGGSSQADVRVVSPGLVIMRGVLSPEQQVWLARYALHAGGAGQDVGSEGHSFWATLPSGEKVLNSDSGRGRIYDAIETFPRPDVVRVRHLFHFLSVVKQNMIIIL
jgi:hypothetical protein